MQDIAMNSQKTLHSSPWGRVMEYILWVICLDDHVIKRFDCGIVVDEYSLERLTLYNIYHDEVSPWEPFPS